MTQRHYSLSACSLRAALACLALLLSLILGSVRTVSGAQSAEPRAALRFGVASEALRLDPRFATDALSSRIDRLLYAQLVDFDERFNVVPGIANWQRLHANHYRFTLRDDRAPFHDGRPLTSADVLATYTFVLQADSGSPHRGGLDVIERMETPDVRTIDFFLRRPDPMFPGRLVVGIVPGENPDTATAGAGTGSAVPIGSGAFEYLGRNPQGDVRLLRRRDDQVFEFVRVPKPTVRVLKLLRGEIDMLQNDLATELVGWLQRQPGVRVQRAAGTGFAYLGFNLEDPLTGNLAIRRAISHAIDKDALVKYLRGEPPAPLGMVLVPDHWAALEDPPVPAYSPDRARTLLKSVGFGPSNRLHLVYKTSTDPLRVRIASVIQQQLSQVGIDVDVRSYDWGTFYGDVKAGNFQMYSLSWVGIKLPDIFRYVFHSQSIPPNGANRGRLMDVAVDRLIELAEQSPNETAMRAAFGRLQERLWELLPYVPLWYEGQVFAARCDIAGYTLSRDGNYDALTNVYMNPAAGNCQ